MSEETRRAAREFVRRELERSGRSRAQVVKDAGIDAKTLRTFLSGERWPQAEKRTGISLALGWEPDELDFIERTGEHRGVVWERDALTGELSSKQLMVSRTSLELTRRYMGAIEFATYVGGHFILLAEQADELVQSTTRLWTAAHELQKQQRDADEPTNIDRAVGSGSVATPTPISPTPAIDIMRTLPDGSIQAVEAKTYTGTGKTTLIARHAVALRNRMVHGSAATNLSEADELVLEVVENSPELIADQVPGEVMDQLQLTIAARRAAGRTPGQQQHDALAGVGEESQDPGGLE